MAFSHDAFMSYSHAADSKLARTLESALEKLAKPLLKLRAIDIFRDETTLTADPRLWGTIVMHLESSKWFLLMASPESAGSPWCAKEVGWWLEHRSPDRLLIVLTAGALAWDSAVQDFDWAKTTALPKELGGKLSAEPLYVDLRWARKVNDLSLRETRFREAVVSIAAPIRGVTRDELYSEDARQLKRNRRIVGGLQLSVGALAAIAVGIAAVAWQQRNVARTQRDEALKTQSLFLADLAAQQVVAGDSETGILLARAALPRHMQRPERPYVQQAETALYRAVTAPARKVYFRTTAAEVRGAALLPNGVRVLTVSTDGVLRAIDVAGGVETQRLRTSGPYLAAALSPAGDRIVTLSSNNAMNELVGHILDPVTGSEIAGKLTRLLDKYHVPNFGNPIAISAYRSNQLVIMQRSDYGTLTGMESRVLWNLMSGKFAKIVWTNWRGHADREPSWVASPDGARVAVLAGHSVRLFEVMGREVDIEMGPWDQSVELKGHQADVLSAQFSTDGRRIVTSTQDGTVRIWDTQTGALILLLEGHKGAVSAVDFSSDGLRIVTASADGTARIWDANNGSEIIAMKAEGISSVRFSADDRYVLAQSEDKTRIWNARTGIEASGVPETDRRVTYTDDSVMVERNSGIWIASLYGHDGPVTSVTFSPTGRVFATASTDRTVRLWDAERGVELNVLRGHLGEIHEAVFDPSGDFIVTAGDTTARVWEVDSGRELFVLPHQSGEILGAEFSPDGRHVVTAFSTGTAHVWDFRNSRKVAVLSGHKKSITRAFFIQRGREIVTVSADGTVRRWDVGSGTEITRFEGHEGPVLCAALTLDQELMVTSSVDGTVRLWKFDTGLQLRRLRLKWEEEVDPWAKPVKKVAFSFDSKVVMATSANVLRIWSTQSGELLHEVDAGAEIAHAEFSPDDRRIVTASADGLVRVWAADTGQEIAILRDYPARATHAVFSPNAQRIVTASEEGTAHLLRFFPTTQALIEYSHSQLNRVLNEQERLRFFLDSGSNTDR